MASCLSQRNHPHLGFDVVDRPKHCIATDVALVTGKGLHCYIAGTRVTSIGISISTCVRPLDHSNQDNGPRVLIMFC